MESSTGAPSVSFGAGTAQLNLPGTGALGAVLSGLTQGDIVDFFNVSSKPGTLFPPSSSRPIPTIRTEPKL